MATEVIATRMDARLIAKIRERAEHLGLTVSSVIRMTLEDAYAEDANLNIDVHRDPARTNNLRERAEPVTVVSENAFWDGLG